MHGKTEKEKLRWRDTPLRERVPPELPYWDRERWLRSAREREEGWDYKDGLADWLAGLDWEMVFTGTFADQVENIEVARRAFRRFRHKLGRGIYGRNYYKRRGEGVTACVAYELQKRGSLHVHALLAGLRDVRYASVRDAWASAIAGSGTPRTGFCWVEAFRTCAAIYVTKYVTKDTGPGAEWDIHGPGWTREGQLWLPTAG